MLAVTFPNTMLTLNYNVTFEDFGDLLYYLVHNEILPRFNEP